MGRRKTSVEFISECNIQYNNFYDYSLINYINNKTKIKIICPIHGEFEQTPDKHLNRKVGCNKCINHSIVKTNNYLKTLIDRFNEKHNNFYDYSLVKGVNSQTKIKIICPIHGEFEQTPNNHLFGYGCSGCGGTKRMTNNDFINKAIKIHGNNYDYSLIDYINYQSKVKIICPKHGIFEQSFTKHCIRKQGCPICKESKGEREIRNYLIENDIKFIPQHVFNGCKNIKFLPFDFYLTDYNTCIEYNGLQHYEPIKYFGGEKKLKQQIINDDIKDTFCKDNNINIYVIKYNENIEKSLKNIIYGK